MTEEHKNPYQELLEYDANDDMFLPLPAPYGFGSPFWPGLAKVIEEMGETAQVIGKLMMTGGRPNHWDGTNLYQRLDDELADLLAAVDFFRSQNASKLDLLKSGERRTRKLGIFRGWQIGGERPLPALESPEQKIQRELDDNLRKGGWKIDSYDSQAFEFITPKDTEESAASLLKKASDSLDAILAMIKNDPGLGR